MPLRAHPGRARSMDAALPSHTRKSLLVTCFSFFSGAPGGRMPAAFRCFEAFARFSRRRGCGEPGHGVARFQIATQRDPDALGDGLPGPPWPGRRRRLRAAALAAALLSLRLSL